MTNGILFETIQYLLPLFKFHFEAGLFQGKSEILLTIPFQLYADGFDTNELF